MAESPLFREIKETPGFHLMKYPEGDALGDVLFRAGNGFFLLPFVRHQGNEASRRARTTHYVVVWHGLCH